MSTSPSLKHSLKFGFSTLGCPELDVDAVRTLAAQNEMSFIEVRTLNKSLDFPQVLASFPGGVAGARDFWKEAGVYAISVSSSFCILTSTPEQQAALLKEAEVGHTLGARWIRIFGGGEWGDPLDARKIEAAKKTREWWQRIRSEKGWTIDLLLETHDSLSGSEIIESFFAQTGGPMALLWDTHHTWKLSGENVADTWRRLGAWIVQVHAKDSTANAAGGSHYTYAVPGKGEFPLQEMFGLLQAAQFDGVISLEWERQWHPELAPLAEVLPHWRDLARSYRPYPGQQHSVPETLLSCDFSRVSLTQAQGPYFHGSAEQYLDVTGVELKSSAHRAGPQPGGFRLYCEGGDESQRTARIERDASGAFLRYRITEPNVTLVGANGVQRKSRIQSELYGNRGLTNFYQTMKVRFSPDLARLKEFPESFGWFTLVEIWNQAFWTSEPYPFRISLGLTKPNEGSGELYFHADANLPLPTGKFKVVWHEVNNRFIVPFGTWLHTELYYQEGSESDGRLWFAVTPAGGSRQVLWDVRKSTHHPDNPHPNGVKQLNSLKAYTSDTIVDYLKSQGAVLQVDWADLRLHAGVTPEKPPLER